MDVAAEASLMVFTSPPEWACAIDPLLFCADYTIAHEAAKKIVAVWPLGSTGRSKGKHFVPFRGALFPFTTWCEDFAACVYRNTVARHRFYNRFWGIDKYESQKSITSWPLECADGKSDSV